MISATGLVLIAFLVILLAVALWWFGVAYKYYQTLSVFAYTRGANLDTGTTPTTKGTGDVHMTCDPDRTICVVRANAICTGASTNTFPTLNNSEAGPEPISNGVNPKNPYGDFDTQNTIDLTEKIGAQVNGKQSATYHFDETGSNFGNGTCNFTYDPTTGIGTRPQLIATYTCIPNGQACKSVKGRIGKSTAPGGSISAGLNTQDTNMDINNSIYTDFPSQSPLYMGSREFTRW